MAQQVRKDWDAVWVEVAHAVARRSLCARAQCGAVIVDAHNRIIATGYNGAPAAYPTDNGDCLSFCPRATGKEPMAGYEDCISIHAEANALLFCDRRDREGGTIYVTSSVCFGCAKLIANSGLHRVVIDMSITYDYRDPQKSVDFLSASGIEVSTWT